MLGHIPDPGSGKVPVIFPARPLADSFTATARLSPLHVYTSHTRPLYTSPPTRQNLRAALTFVQQYRDKHLFLRTCKILQLCPNQTQKMRLFYLEFWHGYIPIWPAFKCNMTSVIVCNPAHQFNAHQQDVYLQTDTFRNAMQHFR